MEWQDFVIKEVYNNGKCYLITSTPNYHNCHWEHKFIYREGDNIIIETKSRYVTMNLAGYRKKTIEPRNFHTMAYCYDHMISHGLSPSSYNRYLCTEYSSMEVYYSMRELID